MVASSESAAVRGHGPWVDVHAHPGRTLLTGLSRSAPAVQLLGPEDSGERLQSARTAGVAAVNASAVADLPVLGVRPDGGLHASRPFEPGEAWADFRRQLDALEASLAAPGVRPVLAPADIVAAAATGEVGAVLGCEGGDFLEGDAGRLADVATRGLRTVTLVHYRPNELGDIQTDDPMHGGLSPAGREVVREMNRLGMIVDLAHATFGTTVDTLEVSTRPIMISHSHLARPGASHPRLLSEKHAAAVAEAGGLIGAWPAGIVAQTLDDFCDEICRLVDLVGVDHVGVGTDMDANYRPVLTSYDQFPDVAARLRSRGMTSAEVDQVLGGNFLSLFEAVVQGG